MGWRRTTLVGLFAALAACGGPDEPGPALSDSGAPTASAWRRIELSFDPPIPLDEHSGEVASARLEGVTELDGRWIAVLTSEMGDLEVESTDLAHWSATSQGADDGAYGLSPPRRLGDAWIRTRQVTHDDESRETVLERSTDGVAWSRWEITGPELPLEIRGVESLGDDTVMLGTIATGEFGGRGRVWIARGGGDFAMAEDPPWAEIDALVVGPGRVGDEVVALTEAEAEGVPPTATVWRSRDGVTWTADATAVPGIGARGVVTLPDRAVFGGHYGAAVTVSADGVARTGPERPRDLPWEIAHDDRFDSPVAWGDAAVLPGTVVERADADFCYDDLASCRRPLARLLVIDDGAQGREIALPEVDDGRLWIASVVVADDRVVLVGTIGREVWREIGNDGPEQYFEEEAALWVFDRVDGSLPAAVPIDEPQPNPPRHPTLAEGAVPEVDKTYRAMVPIGGGCGAGRISRDERYWQVTEEWGEWPYPDDWPVRHLGGVSDAPTDYLYGVIILHSDDTISVGIERGDEVETLRVYEPADAPQVFCG